LLSVGFSKSVIGIVFHFHSHTPAKPGDPTNKQKIFSLLSATLRNKEVPCGMASMKPDPEQTFVQLVVNHQPALRAFVLSLLPGSPEVEDVIQETNAEIWVKRGDFRIGTEFKSWMFSVAKFKVMAVWRDHQRRKVWAVPDETLLKLVERIEAGEFADTDARHEALRFCLTRLRAEDRMLILNRYIAGHNLDRLARELGRKKESLKVSLHRIRMALKVCTNRRIRSGGMGA
jgi:RNA polymerase sigma-70 factor (ECF subfamily)